MSKYVIREQRASYSLPTRTTDAHAPTNRRTPLPDLGLDATRRPSTSTRRYVPNTQGSMRVILHDERKQRSVQEQVPHPQPKPKKQRHPLYYMVVGIAIPVVLWLVISGIGGWWSSYQEHQKYGMPRTYQTDARVGHSDDKTPSHFIAVNLNGRISVTEFPGGHIEKAVVYIGPTLLGEGQEQTIVTLDFADVNADTLPDMVILFNKTSHVLLNTGTAFREAGPGEQISVGGGGK